MDEYIKRDDVLDLLTDRDVVINPNDEVVYIMEDVECLPAADVRPVVLCRDCKYHIDNKCLWHIRFTTDDDYCSAGKKREES